jgi:hypothetical protein
MRLPAENGWLSQTSKTIYHAVRYRLESIYIQEPLGVSALHKPYKHVLALGFINFDDPQRQVLNHLPDGPIPVTGHKEPTDPGRNLMQTLHTGRELTSRIEVRPPFPTWDVLFFKASTMSWRSQESSSTRVCFPLTGISVQRNLARPFTTSVGGSSTAFCPLVSISAW